MKRLKAWKLLMNAATIALLVFVGTAVARLFMPVFRESASGIRELLCWQYKSMAMPADQFYTGGVNNWPPAKMKRLTGKSF